jgi:hypothetical protein
MTQMAADEEECKAIRNSVLAIHHNIANWAGLAHLRLSAAICVICG